MKYMKIGILPDTFYTEEAARTVLSDVPSDLTIQINNVRYRLHKCGLLQRLCSDFDDSNEPTSVLLNDIPGGEEAFELCAKFCYGIAIDLSARNFVPAICAAKFLRMTESVSRGNLVMKLETFFDTCILQGWKDSIVTLQATRKLTSWSENIGIVHRCMNSVIQKILTHPTKVAWSYTYTRPGYDRKQHHSVPKDWWTEDVSDLDLDLFRTIISSIKSTEQLPPRLIGEALHVYSSKHLPDPMDAQTLESSSATTEEMVQKQRKTLESIVSMIPTEYGSVSGSFLLKLLKVASYVGASPSVKSELIRRSGHQLHEAKAQDLLFPSPSNLQIYDIDLVEAVLQIFLIHCQRPVPQEDADSMILSMRTVAKIVDSYLQMISHSPETPVSKIINLACSLPELARLDHNDLYQAINMYLREHPDISKAEKKQLSQILDCRKLSSEVRSHAIRNDQLPLRTIVQVLFVEQEKAARGSGSSQNTPRTHPTENQATSNAHSHGFTKAESGQVDRQERGYQEAHKTQNKVDGRMGKSRSMSEPKVAKKKGTVVNVEEGQGSSSKIK